MPLRTWPRAALTAAFALAALSCNRGSSSATSGASASASASAAASVPVAARCAAVTGPRLERASAAGASAAVALVSVGGRRVALVADADEQALHAVDVASMQQLGVTPLPGRPGHVLALSDGSIAVGLRDQGRVLLLAATDERLGQPFSERCAAVVAAEPIALAEVGERLLVASGYGSALTALRRADLVIEREIPLNREPRALLATGQAAFVVHLAGHLSHLDLSAPDGAPQVISLDGVRPRAASAEKPEKPEKITRGASQGFAIAALFDATKGEGAPLRVFVPHTSVEPGAAETEPTSGYGASLGVRAISPRVSVIDPVAKVSITNDVMKSQGSGFFQQDCLLPRGAVAEGPSLFVTCANLDAVLELDSELFDPIAGERRRIAVPAGPGGVTLSADGKELLVHSEFDRALSRIDRGTGAVSSVALWRRAGVPRDPLVERGRRLFHATRDVRIAKGRACASCHPDGRDDGLTWSSPDGPRQTMTLAGRLDKTGPFGWFGESATVRQHVQRTFERLGGLGLDKAPEDVDALLAYVAVLPPLPTAHATDPTAAARGKDLFAARCASCHKDTTTNGVAYDVGSGSKKERRQLFDTPSLRGVRATAPYFHDGRYATLLDVLSATDNRMIAAPLSEPDKRSLLAYLETL